MTKKKVFVSFDYDKDKRYKYLLEAWDANSKFQFVFSDFSSKEIQSESISKIRSELTKKINKSAYTIVIIGKEANKKHKDHSDIGYDNWLNFEIAKSKENKNKIIGVKLDKSYVSPDEIIGCGASWAMVFKEDVIISALENI